MDSKIIEGYTISSSYLAKLIVGEGKIPCGSSEDRHFGKRFEESYEEFSYEWEDLEYDPDKTFFVPNISLDTCPGCEKPLESNDEWGFLDALETCEMCGQQSHAHCTLLNEYVSKKDFSVYQICNNCINPFLLHQFSQKMNHKRALRIATGFLKKKIKGKTPATVFRKIWSDHYIAAKPDLYDSKKIHGVKYIEFKTYPLDEYTRAQAFVFSWVLNRPILLVGWNNGDVEIETIFHQDNQFKIPFSQLTENDFKKSVIDCNKIL